MGRSNPRCLRSCLSIRPQMDAVKPLVEEYSALAGPSFEAAGAIFASILPPDTFKEPSQKLNGVCGLLGKNPEEVRPLLMANQPCTVTVGEIMSGLNKVGEQGCPADFVKDELTKQVARLKHQKTVMDALTPLLKQ